MDTQKLHDLIDKVIGKSGPLRVPAYWMRRVLKKVVGYLTELKARIDAMPEPGRGLNYDNISGKVNVDDSVVMVDETTPERDIFSGDELIPIVEGRGVKVARISSLFPDDYAVELPELTLPLTLKQDTQSSTWPTPTITVLASYWGYRLPGDTSTGDQFNVSMQELLNTMEDGQSIRIKLVLDTPLFTSEPLIVAAEKRTTPNYAGVSRYLNIKRQFKSLVVRYKYNLSNTMKPVYLTSSISGDISITMKTSLLGYAFVVNAFDDNYGLCIDYRHPELFRTAWILRNTNMNSIWANLDIGIHLANINASNQEFTILSKGSLATYKLSYSTTTQGDSGSIDLVAKVDITDSGDGTKFLSDDGTYKEVADAQELQELSTKYNALEERLNALENGTTA